MLHAQVKPKSVRQQPSKAMTELAEVFTSRLVLLRTRTEHWEYHRLLDGDPEVMRTLGGVRSIAETQDYIAAQAHHWDEHGFGWWTILDRASHEFAGRGGLRHIELDDGLEGIEVGYALAPAFWGRGLATEIAKAAMEVGTEALGLDRILGIALPSNAASRRVLEKAGLLYIAETEYKGFPQVLFEWTRRD